MALGYERLPGSSRQYRNKRTGKVLSRRQYDKLVQAARKRGKAPPKVSPSPVRSDRQQRLQRQYNALLESYVRNQAARGKPITKKAARESAAFKRAVKMIRTPRPAGETAFQRAARIAARQMGLDIVGGDEFFRQVYDRRLAETLDDGDADWEDAA